MVRPLKYYVTILHNEPHSIVHGLAAVRKAPKDTYNTFWSYNSREAAEEAIAWHEYRRWQQAKPAATLVPGYTNEFVTRLF